MRGRVAAWSHATRPSHYRTADPAWRGRGVDRLHRVRGAFGRRLVGGAHCQSNPGPSARAARRSVGAAERFVRAAVAAVHPRASPRARPLWRRLSGTCRSGRLSQAVVRGVRHWACCSLHACRPARRRCRGRCASAGRDVPPVLVLLPRLEDAAFSGPQVAGLSP